MEEPKFANLINHLSVIAETDKWTPRYDQELDYFYWTRDTLSDDTALIKVSHETSLYVNHDKEIEGVLVEYITQNFIEHNPVYKEFIKTFTKKTADGLLTVEHGEKTEKYLFGLGEALRADIYQDANEYHKDLNLDSLVNYALSN